MTNDKPGWTTTLQQDLARAREAVEKVSANAHAVGDSATIIVARSELDGLHHQIEAMERKLQVARCTAIAALEDL